MKSHAVRPCARRRRRGCPFPGPPCRPGRRRTCVYGRNELHPSRHGHLTGLGRSDAPRRGRRGYFARRASHDTARRGGRDKRGPPVWRRAISLRNRSARLICGVSAREVPAPPSARDVQLWLGTGAAARRGCGRDKRGPPVRGRAISLRNRSTGLICGVSAREVPAPPSARDVRL